MKRYTLCIPYDGKSVVLGMKRRGFGEGLWNGFGGKIEQGESVEDAARRELLEESTLVPRSMEHCATIYFTIQSLQHSEETFVFLVACDDEAQETDEMTPKRFLLADIPYKNMWAADAMWLPKVLAGERFTAHIDFLDEKTVVASRYDLW